MLKEHRRSGRKRIAPKRFEDETCCVSQAIEQFKITNTDKVLAPDSGNAAPKVQTDNTPNIVLVGWNHHRSAPPLNTNYTKNYKK